MQRLEFLTYSASGQAPAYVLCGFRVDGVDLRTYVTEASRAHWHREYETDVPSRAEREKSLLIQHRGLPLGQLEDPVRHFLGEPAGDFSREAVAELVGAPAPLPPGTTPLLSCPCGIWQCWHLLGVITLTARTVTWSGLHQGRRPEWGVLAGPFTFDRSSYEHALAHPTRLTNDPLAPLDE
ncbi:hypothetical protein GCM10010329_32470 [Streptomyces spiroverticillatus]|uniref:Uncharacterized protein n=1 Tax=Streptomyces finlayi TaxID=67296 RepID=A0A918WWC2_9ACTN|nr:hypothetical protein [Streptomyces finlayi]GHA07254.1 hypothetical protein GCM10010329_32470 [Streptomyces spiroverticillatus]GHC90682.1 hypothetical protein GCM10010334_24880 [Streptomyces finlayi]